jgi:hypothetical protein
MITIYLYIHNIISSEESYSCSTRFIFMNDFLFKKYCSIFATRISWADFNDIERKFKNSSEPYLYQLFLTKRDASKVLQ